MKKIVPIHTNRKKEMACLTGLLAFMGLELTGFYAAGYPRAFVDLLLNLPSLSGSWLPWITIHY